MLEPGLQWSVGKWSWSLFSTQQYRIGQDTMINSTSYKTLDTRWWPTDDWALDGAMREDSAGRVYLTNFTDEVLLYDFSLEVGDSVQFTTGTWQWCEHDGVVAAVDSVQLLDGSWRKRLRLDFWPSSGVENFWIEGIGSSQGLQTECHCITDCIEELRCFSRNDTLLYNPSNLSCFASNVGVQTASVEREIRVVPNPFWESAVLDVSALRGKARWLEVLDLQGRRLRVEALGGGSEHQLERGSLEPGLFIFRVLTSSGQPISTGRFLILDGH